MQKSLLWLLVFLSGSFYATAQSSNGQVAGTVKTETGEVVEQANIQVINSSSKFSSSTVSTAKGTFSFSKLAAGGPYTFIITLVGFETETLTGNTVEADKTLHVAVILKPHTKKLDDIVVTGYGKSSKRNVAGAITSISSNAILNDLLNEPIDLIMGKGSDKVQDSVLQKLQQYFNIVSAIDSVQNNYTKPWVVTENKAGLPF